VCPPGEWWRVYREPTPAIESESDSSGNNDRESATSTEYMLADSGNEAPDVTEQQAKQSSTSNGNNCL
jgi:hypothetical protein